MSISRQVVTYIGGISFPKVRGGGLLCGLVKVGEICPLFCLMDFIQCMEGWGELPPKQPSFPPRILHHTDSLLKQNI